MADTMTMAVLALRRAVERPQGDDTGAASEWRARGPARDLRGRAKVRRPARRGTGSSRRHEGSIWPQPLTTAASPASNVSSRARNGTRSGAWHRPDRTPCKRRAGGCGGATSAHGAAILRRAVL